MYSGVLPRMFRLSMSGLASQLRTNADCHTPTSQQAPTRPNTAKATAQCIPSKHHELQPLSKPTLHTNLIWSRNLISMCAKSIRHRSLCKIHSASRPVALDTPVLTIPYQPSGPTHHHMPSPREPACSAGDRQDCNSGANPCPGSGCGTNPLEACEKPPHAAAEPPPFCGRRGSTA